MDTQREFLKVPEVAEELRIARSRAYELGQRDPPGGEDRPQRPSEPQRA